MEGTSTLNVKAMQNLSDSKVQKMLERFVNENATVFTEYTFNETESELPRKNLKVRF